MQIRGVLDVIEETTMVSDSFSRRGFVVVSQNNLERMEYIKFELHNTKCSLLDSYKIGDKLLINFQIQGNKWATDEGKIKYFTTLKAWRLDKIVEA